MKMDRRTFLAGSALTAASLVGTRSARAASADVTLRVVQIGMQGHWGDIMIGMPDVPNCRLVAVARSYPDEPIERLEKQPAWRDETQVYEDYRKMLDEERPDIVAVFMPYAWNGPAILEAVRRGCHVLSEKPLATDLPTLDAIRRERDARNVRVSAMLGMRLMPAMQAARRAVREGKIGEPLLISAQKSYRWGNNRPWYFKRRATYGGSIPWVAIHAIDFIRFVTGLDYREVTARHAMHIHEDYPECEVFGALLFGMSNGAFATLTFDYLRPKAAASHGDDRLRVAGSEGIVEIRQSRELVCELVTADQEAHTLPMESGKHNIFADFVAALRGEGTHYLTPEDPFIATEVAIRARMAADASRTMTLPR